MKKVIRTQGNDTIIINDLTGGASLSINNHAIYLDKNELIRLFNELKNFIQ